MQIPGVDSFKYYVLPIPTCPASKPLILLFLLLFSLISTPIRIFHVYFLKHLHTNDQESLSRVSQRNKNHKSVPSTEHTEHAEQLALLPGGRQLLAGLELLHVWLGHKFLLLQPKLIHTCSNEQCFSINTSTLWKIITANRSGQPRCKPGFL